MRILKANAIAPLQLNGYALVANAGLSSALGIVFWMLATRLYSQDQVGLAAALISSMTTISYLSQMNLSSFLTRFIPTAHAGAGRLILSSYGAAGILATLVATAFALGVGDFAEPLEVIRKDAFAMTLFVAATVIWTVFALQDAALSGLRRSVLVPIENAIYSVLKILFLIGLAMLIVPMPGGIFLAWTLPLVPVVIGVNFMIFRGLPNRNPTDRSQGPDLRTVTRFLGWDFLGSIALAVGLGVAPLMVTASAGVSSTASYHLAWSFAYSVYLVGRAMSVSLVAEGAAQPMRLRRLIADTLSHTLILVSGAVVVMVAAAPLIMGIFGQSYVEEGAPILRVLVLSCLPWAVTTIYCAAARVLGQTHFVALVQACTLGVLVATSAILLPVYGALGVALGWLVAHTTVCLGIVITIAVRGGTGALFDWILALAASAARIAGVLLAQARGIWQKSDAKADIPPGDMEHPALAGLTPRPLAGSLSDVKVALLISSDPHPGDVKAVLKYATSARGIAALRRSVEAQQMLASDKRLAEYSELIPKIQLAEQVDEGFRIVETAVTGIEGRKFLVDPVQGKAGMAVAASTMTGMHRQTSSLRLLDEDWARTWIDQPIDVAASSRAWFGNAEERAAAFEGLRAYLREVFVGREEFLGLGHGDLWPGNLFFSKSDDLNAKVAMTGLIDWDTVRTDALAASDTCHLGLTVRMALTGEELGPVVRDFLSTGGWTPEEREMLGSGGPGDEPNEDFDRAIVLLTWLNHIAIVLGKSDRISANPIWSAVNVDRVLPLIARISGVQR